MISIDWSQFDSAAYLTRTEDSPRLGDSLWRAHRSDSSVLRFSTSGTGRFDPPATNRPPQYGTCYFSTSPTDAFLEKFDRIGPYLADHLVRQTAVTEVQIAGNLRIADLTRPESTGGHFGTYDPFFLGDYAESQRRGEEFFSAGYDAVLYRTQHHGGYEAKVLAVFGKPGDDPLGSHRPQLETLKEVLMDDLLYDMQRLHDVYVFDADDTETAQDQPDADAGSDEPDDAGE